MRYLVLAGALMAGLAASATSAAAATFNFTGEVSRNDGLPVAVGSAVTGTFTVDLNAIGTGSSLGFYTVHNNVLTDLQITIGLSTWSMISPPVSRVVIDDGGSGSIAETVAFSSSTNSTTDNAAGPPFGTEEVLRVQFGLIGAPGTLQNETSLSVQQILDLWSTNTAGDSISFVATQSDEVRFNTTSLTYVAPIPLPASSLLLVGGLGALYLRRRRAA